jgi:hypothetical protein
LVSTELIAEEGEDDIGSDSGDSTTARLSLFIVLNNRMHTCSSLEFYGKQSTNKDCMNDAFGRALVN